MRCDAIIAQRPLLALSSTPPHPSSRPLPPLPLRRCMASARWDAIIVLFCGAVYQAFAYSYNLGHVT